jgi:uncharacterized repeat protein (TIGR04138 family)
VSPEVAVFWDKIRCREQKYPPAAYTLVQEGLRSTVRTLAEHKDEFGESHHVTGQELCLGIRDFALEEYGPLARTVLQSLRINSTEDFGRIVFTLVDVGLMRKTDEDSMDDFTGVFDFDEAFASPLSAC